MAALVDTNVLVYSFDSRYPRKRRVATELLRQAAAAGDPRGLSELYVSHQAIVEFVSVVTRPTDDGPPLLERPHAWREAEELLSQFEVLYPNEALLRLALRGAETYQLSWYDAHMWAYAEHYGLGQLLTEDFQHGRLYGSVRAVNPFAE